jgi:hypothetical protein
MNDIGWIKLHRKLIDWEWYKDVNTFKLFLHLLLKANTETKKWQGQTINRGQLITSLKNLSHETGLTEKEVRTAISKLEKTKEVGKQTTSVNTTLTILNYDLYQSMGKPTDKQKANEGQSKGKQGATTKEYKEEEELKEDKEILFEQFWKLYDNKQDRVKSEKKFMSLDLPVIEKIINVVPLYTNITTTSKDNTKGLKFRKNPLTWLNGECWNDEIKETSNLQNAPQGYYYNSQGELRKTQLD